MLVYTITDREGRLWFSRSQLRDETILETCLPKRDLELARGLEGRWEGNRLFARASRIREYSDVQPGQTDDQDLK